MKTDVILSETSTKNKLKRKAQAQQGRADHLIEEIEEHNPLHSFVTKSMTMLIKHGHALRRADI